MRIERFGDLDAVLTGGEADDGGGDGPVVVLLHGFGAPADDLVPLGKMLDVPRTTRFVMPAAPLELESGYGGGRAWWLIDLMRIQAQLAAGEERNLSAEIPDGLAAAHAQVVALLGEVERKLGVPGSRIVLGGFSQGAMLACDIALRTARPLAGLVLLSGTLLAEHEWVPLMPARRGLKVFQSHGLHDVLLPYGMAARLRDHLRAAGLALDWVEFPGGHEIPHRVMDRLAGFLSATVGPGR